MQPWLGGGAADAMEVLVEGTALEWREGEADVWEHGSLGWIEAMSFEVLLGDLNECFGWGKGLSATKDLLMQFAREQLNSELISFDNWIPVSLEPSRRSGIVQGGSEENDKDHSVLTVKIEEKRRDQTCEHYFGKEFRQES